MSRKNSYSILKVYVLLVFVLLSTTTGCEVKEYIGSEADSILASLDKAIGSLTSEAAVIEDILNTALNELPDDVQSTIRNELTNTLDHAIAAAGVEARCEINFIRTRVIQDLQRIRAMYLDQPYPPIEPYVCKVIPSVIDMNLESERRPYIEILGYDFDRGTPPIEVFLQENTSQGEYIVKDISESLDYPSHFQLTLNLGGGGVPLTKNSQRIIINWNNETQHTIGIVHPTTPICKEDKRYFDPGVITYMPPNINGDNEFGGNGPWIKVEVWLTHNSTQVFANIKMDAKETGGDESRAMGTYTEAVYTVPSGWIIEEIIDSETQVYEYTDNNHNTQIFYLASPVHHLEIYGNTKGNDIGRYTKVDVYFRDNLELRVIEDKNCVTEEQLLNTENTDLLLLDEETRERLMEETPSPSP